MLHFAFDNDALENLVMSPDFDGLKTSAQNTSISGRMKCHFTSTNFAEIVAGVNSRNFSWLQKIVAKSSEITSSNGRINLLLSTATVMKNELGDVPIDQLEDEARRLSINLNMFTTAADYDKFLKFAGSSRRQLFATKMDAWFDNKRALERASAIWNERGLDYFSYENRQVFHSSIWKNGKHLGPKVETVSNDVKRFEEECPGSFWFGETLRSFLGSTFRNKRKARKGDFLDFMRIVYLAYCDYLVTDDRSLIALVEDSGNPNLQGRLIRSESFVSELGSRSLGKRRPKSANKWLTKSHAPV